MAGNKKVTVKSLSEELANVKEELKEMQFLKQKVEELETEIRALKSSESVEEHQKIQCRKCRETFPSTRNLKEHIKNSHPKLIDCRHCEQTFSSNVDLENHAEEHKLEKHFKCDICGKKFYLEWRMTKHKTVHHEDTKPCRYSTSRRRCPFEAVGCKFRHDDSPVLGDKIQEQDLTEDDDEEVVHHVESYSTEASDGVDKDNEEDGVDEDDSVINENQCHLCKKQLSTKDELWDHVESVHVDYFQEMVEMAAKMRS